MKIIGVDENGLGSILGPLVITFTVFSAPFYDKEFFWQISRKVADSKKIMRFRKIKKGEEIVFLFYYLLHQKFPQKASELIKKIEIKRKKTFCKKCHPEMKKICQKEEVFLPQEIKNEEIEKIKKEAEIVQKKMKKMKIKLLEIKSFIICPLEFNQKTQNQSKIQLELFFIKKIEKKFLKESSKVLFLCDRVGKNFIKKADRSHFPVALSSIFGKYLREIFIKKQNQFFQKICPSVRAVSGYRDHLTKKFIKETQKIREKINLLDICFLRKK